MNTTQATNALAKANVSMFVSALKLEFPNATFKTTWTKTPYGKTAAIVTGYGEVAVWDMDAVANRFTSPYVYIGTKANTYALI
jgi:hypothetical protein